MTSKKPFPKKTASSKNTGKKKKASKSGKKAGKKKHVDVSSQLKKVVIGVVVLVGVCLTGAMLADLLIRRPQSLPPGKTDTRSALSSGEKSVKPVTGFKESRDAVHIKPQGGLMEKNGHPVLYEVFESMVDTPEPLSDPSPQFRQSGDDLIRIALIIDDIGYDKQVAMDLYQLEPNISFSILPWSPHGRTLSRILKDRGAEIMLHLPMEPEEYPEVNPGPGALLAGMSPDVLIAQLEKNLIEVPGASGVNNHMGSRLTTEASQMYQIFTIFKKRDLFFIDSMTAPRSQCRAAARLLQVRFAERDVFLDNIQEQAYITGQFAQLKKIAQKYGTAIGIGHPYPATLETLKIELPKIRGKIKIVPASELVGIPG
jgi:uncharacterized protein